MLMGMPELIVEVTLLVMVTVFAVTLVLKITVLACMPIPPTVWPTSKFATLAKVKVLELILVLLVVGYAFA